MPDFSDPLVFLLTVLAMFAIVSGRYLLIAALFHSWFYVYRKDRWMLRRLGKKQVDKKQYLREVKWSLITSLLFAVAGAITAVLWQKGFTKIYTIPS